MLGWFMGVSFLAELIPSVRQIFRWLLLFGVPGDFDIRDLIVSGRGWGQLDASCALDGKVWKRKSSITVA